MTRSKYDLKVMLAEIERDRGLERRSPTAKLSQDDIAALFTTPAPPQAEEPCAPTTRS